MNLIKVCVEFVYTNQICLSGTLQLENEEVIIFDGRQKKLKKNLIKTFFNNKTPISNSGIELRQTGKNTVRFRFFVTLDNYYPQKNWIEWVTSGELKRSIKAHVMPEYERLTLLSKQLIATIDDKNRQIELEVAL